MQRQEIMVDPGAHSDANYMAGALQCLEYDPSLNSLTYLFENGF